MVKMSQKVTGGTIYVDPSGEKVWLCVTFGFLSNTAGFPGHVSLKIEKGDKGLISYENGFQTNQINLITII